MSGQRGLLAILPLPAPRSLLPGHHSLHRAGDRACQPIRHRVLVVELRLLRGDAERDDGARRDVPVPRHLRGVALELEEGVRVEGGHAHQHPARGPELEVRAVDAGVVGRELDAARGDLPGGEAEAGELGGQDPLEARRADGVAMEGGGHRGEGRGSRDESQGERLARARPAR